MITEEQIQAVVRRIVEGYQPDRIILFGSYAYGTPTEHSDLDLLIIKEKAEAKRAERSIAVRQLLWGTDAPAMDILIRTPEEMAARTALYYTVEAQAVEKGRTLYASAHA
ncbi:MAG TPA: nucleotidyltransferase domain-containing protein [Hymenobacter sp.]|jgi:predicted nucleotidyltransferase